MSFKDFKFSVLYVCLHDVCGDAHASTWDNFMELVLSSTFTRVPGIELRIPGLGDKHLYLLSHLASPQSIIFKDFSLECVCVVCRWAPQCRCPWRPAEGSGSLEPEFQAVVSHVLCVLGTEPESSVRTCCVLNCLPTSPAHKRVIF